MRLLDMSPYRPFRDMAQTCRTRSIQEKVVCWAKPEPRESRDRRFVVRPLARADFDAAAELWRQSYPEVYGSSHNFMLFPEDYDDRMAVAETWEEDAGKKPYCMLVIQEKATGRLAAASLMTKFDHNLQIEWTFAGTHPDYRQMGLMGLLGDMMEWVSQASGAEYLTTFLETWHTITQAETLKRERGWQLAGIFPGNFTRWTRDQQEYRACEVHMYRLINDGEKYATKPEEWHLHPELQRLWEALEAFNRGLTGSDRG